MQHLDHQPYLVSPDTLVSLRDYPTSGKKVFPDKKAAKAALKHDVDRLADSQRLLWADARSAVLVILQAMDAAGKDSTLRHVMSGVNPQGCRVTGFGPPSDEELRHHFLWRPTRFLPDKGRIGIFNRSYYEEVLVVRVHPELLDRQRLPPSVDRETIWQKRFEDINAFEHSLVRNGTRIVKFFLHVSRQKQKRRFLKRLNDPQKHWKFSAADIRERGYWDQYQRAYEQVLSNTSTRWAPWYILPADNKPVTRALAADILTARINEMPLEYPKVSAKQKQQLAAARKKLEESGD